MPHYRRILERVDQRGADECWPWLGVRLPDGYGTFSVRNGERITTVYAHRAMYELWFGPIPPSAEIDHECRHPWCCNPTHLEAVSQAENLRRIRRPTGRDHHHGRKTHCPQGHAYAGDNLYIAPSGKRACRTCSRAAVKRFYERARMAKAG